MEYAIHQLTISKREALVSLGSLLQWATPEQIRSYSYCCPNEACRAPVSPCFPKGFPEASSPSRHFAARGRTKHIAHCKRDGVLTQQARAVARDEHYVPVQKAQKSSGLITLFRRATAKELLAAPPEHPHSTERNTPDAGKNGEQIPERPRKKYKTRSTYDLGQIVALYEDPAVNRGHVITIEKVTKGTLAQCFKTIAELNFRDPTSFKEPRIFYGRLRWYKAFDDHALIYIGEKTPDGKNVSICVPFETGPAARIQSLVAQLAVAQKSRNTVYALGQFKLVNKDFQRWECKIRNVNEIHISPHLQAPHKL